MVRGLNRRDFRKFQTDSKDLIAALLLRLPVDGLPVEALEAVQHFPQRYGEIKDEEVAL
jgi:hypothetical protein